MIKINLTNEIYSKQTDTVWKDIVLDETIVEYITHWFWDKKLDHENPSNKMSFTLCKKFFRALKSNTFTYINIRRSTQILKPKGN